MPGAPSSSARSCSRSPERSPKGLQIRLILDNYAIHQHPDVTVRLATHPRFHPLVTPTSSSWLDPIECRFRDLTDTAAHRRVVKSAPDLITAIEDYMTTNNKNPTPCVWTATAGDILTKVTRGRAALEAIIGSN